MGNLIVGYNEDLEGPPNDRNGSHNLVIGIEHTYSNFGGLVVGFRNTISGGGSNKTLGYLSSISRGENNTATGAFSSVSSGINLNAKNENGWRAGGLKQR